MSHAPTKNRPPGEMLAYLPGAGSLLAYGESRDREDCRAFRTGRHGSEAKAATVRNAEHSEPAGMAQRLRKAKAATVRNAEHSELVGMAGIEELLYTCLNAPVIP